MSFHTEVHLAKSLYKIEKVRDFLIRFIEAADSHVELADLVDEGRQLIREIGI